MSGNSDGQDLTVHSFHEVCFSPGELINVGLTPPCRETRERTSADCWWTADLSKVNSSKFTVSKQKKNQPEKCLPNSMNLEYSV